ncbi:T9SS type A sorting domain-containing protein [Corallibacter sp.]|uniref:T9SS type A sorting domain-containing protein n=1 Tax=Corallibacter sp. TaxID=2038084 RepID=UPI003AB75BC4
MKKHYLLLLIAVLMYSVNYGQITFRGCTSNALGPQDYVLNITGTTDDGGVIRQTFESTPSDFSQSCPAGVCEVQIIWNIALSRWEIKLDNDGPMNAPNYDYVLYYNTTATAPFPPDLSTGTWVGDEGVCPDSIITLSGNTLNTLPFEKQDTIRLFPNPSHTHIEISGLLKPTNYSIYSVIGVKFKSGVIANNDKLNIQNLNNGIYLLKLDNNTTFKFIKE